MATIKSFSDLEQSKKLAEILPLESADTIWDLTNPDLPTIRAIPYEDSDYNYKYFNIIAAWSLAALLSVLPDYTLQTNTDGTVFVVCESKKPMISDAYDSPVDACYELIIRLNELNLL